MPTRSPASVRAWSGVDTFIEASGGRACSRSRSSICRQPRGSGTQFERFLPSSRATAATPPSAGSTHEGPFPAARAGKGPSARGGSVPAERGDDAPGSAEIAVRVGQTERQRCRSPGTAAKSRSCSPRPPRRPPVELVLPPLGSVPGPSACTASPARQPNGPQLPEGSRPAALISSNGLPQASSSLCPSQRRDQAGIPVAIPFVEPPTMWTEPRHVGYEVD